MESYNVLYVRTNPNYSMIYICPSVRLSVRPSVRLFHISSAVYGLIEFKLGRNIRHGTAQELRALVSMATKLLSLYSMKIIWWL